MTIHTNPSIAHGFPGDDCQDSTDTPKDLAIAGEQLVQVATWICRGCLENRGGTCHSPGCYFCHAQPPKIFKGEFERVSDLLAAQKEALEKEARIDELVTAAPHLCHNPTNFTYYNERLQHLKETTVTENSDEPKM